GVYGDISEEGLDARPAHPRRAGGQGSGLSVTVERAQVRAAGVAGAPAARVGPSPGAGRRPRGSCRAGRGAPDDGAAQASKSSLSFASCSCDRFVDTSSGPRLRISSAMRSGASVLTSISKAEVPGVMRSRMSLMNLSLMPMSVRAPPTAPASAPMAAPNNGMKKIRPISIPQNVPLSAPAPAVLTACFTLGPLASWGHVTTAASATLTRCLVSMLPSTFMAWSALSGPSNLKTLRVAIPCLLPSRLGGQGEGAGALRDDAGVAGARRRAGATADRPVDRDGRAVHL